MGQGSSGHICKTYGGKQFLIETTTTHTVPLTGTPNRVLQKFDDNGNLEKERYYDSDGRAFKDVDYTNHGNPKKHPKVPHTHVWDWTDPNNPIRSNKDD